MDKISSYEILSKIFIFSRNPEVRLLSHEFYEISTLISFRASFLIKKFGIEKAIKLESLDFYHFPNLFKNEDLVLKLLEKGACSDPSTKKTLFHISIKRGWNKVVGYLLDLFYETTEEEYQKTIQKRRNHPKESISKQKITKYYIPTIDINHSNGNYLSKAVSNKHLYIVIQLLNAHKIKPNLDFDKSNTLILSHPKIYASHFICKVSPDLLEEGGIELLKLFYMSRLKGYTRFGYILSGFCERGNVKFVKFLVENGSNIDEDDGKPLKSAFENKHFDIVKYLVKMGADTSKFKDLEHLLSDQSNSSINDNPPQENNHTLQEASSNGYLDFVKNLVESGADIHENNGIALKEACENGYLDIVKYLVEKGADIHADQDWALGMASKSGHLDVVKYLVEKGANIQARENFALGIACIYRRLNIVKYLIENGADLQAENYWNQIFKDKSKYRDIVNYLDERGSDLYYSRGFILRVACLKGKLDIVKCLIENGADYHADNDEAFRSASENGNFEIVKYLVQNGADIHAKDDQALTSASSKGYLSIVKYLVENGANIHANNDNALRWASMNGHLEIVKHLVEKGADICGDNDYALRWASLHGHLEIVKHLVEKGSNVCANGDCALIFASQKGHLEVVKYLVENGADIHANNNAALRSAIQKGYLEVVKCLLEDGTNIYATKLILEAASIYGQLGIIKLLAEKGVDFHANNDKALVFASKNNRSGVVKYLVENGADTRVVSDILIKASKAGCSNVIEHLIGKGSNIFEDNLRSLTLASENGHLDIVKCLVKNGVDTHTHDDRAFRLASRNGHIDIVKYLLENGTDIHSNNDGALRWASKNGRLRVVKYLIRNEADIHAKNDGALRWASRNGHIEVVKHLIDNGADIYADDNDSLKASIRNGRLDVVECLVENGAEINSIRNVLSTVSRNPSLPIVKYLVENGADIHADNDSALRMAAQNGRLGFFKYLVENGADIHANNDEALILACKNGHLSIVKYLACNGVDISANDNQALRSACGKGYMEIVKFLVQNGADLSANNNEALRIATRNSRFTIVQYLLENGVEMHAVGDILSISSKYARLNIIEYLVENGADIHANNDAALKEASGNGRLNVVKYFVKNGTDINSIDEILSTARSHGHPRIVKYLEESIFLKPKMNRNTNEQQNPFKKPKTSDNEIPLPTNERLEKIIFVLPISFPSAMMPARIPELYHKMKNRLYPDYFYYSILALGNKLYNNTITDEDKNLESLYAGESLELLKKEEDIRNPLYLWTCVILLAHNSRDVDAIVHETIKGLSSVAVRISKIYQLDLSKIAKMKYTEEELEFRRRVFWSFYSFDRLAMFFDGSFPTIQDQDIVVNLPKNDFLWRHGGECKEEHPELVLWNQIANNMPINQHPKEKHKYLVKTILLHGKVTLFARRRWISKIYNPDKDNGQLIKLINNLSNYSDNIVIPNPVDFEKIKELHEKYENTLRMAIDMESQILNYIFNQMHNTMKIVLYQTEMVRIKGRYMHPGRVVSAKNIITECAEKQIDLLLNLNEVLPPNHSENITSPCTLVSGVVYLNLMGINPGGRKFDVPLKLRLLSDEYKKMNSQSKLYVVYPMFLKRLSNLIGESHTGNKKYNILFDKMK
ncbi:hypothetical protein BB558_004622, partial [Smittium angustum]